MPIRRSPNGAAHTSPQTDRDQSESLIGMGRYAHARITTFSRSSVYKPIEVSSVGASMMLSWWAKKKSATRGIEHAVSLAKGTDWGMPNANKNGHTGTTFLWPSGVVFLQNAAVETIGSNGPLWSLDNEVVCRIRRLQSKRIPGRLRRGRRVPAPIHSTLPLGRPPFWQATSQEAAGLKLYECGPSSPGLGRPSSLRHRESMSS